MAEGEKAELDPLQHLTHKERRSRTATRRQNNNISSERALCSAVSPENGPCPWDALQIARKPTIEMAVLVPKAPNRTATQSRNGRGRKSRARSAPDLNS